MSEHDAPAGAAPPCEVVNKTPEEYAATLAKLGVAKVCNKKHRPTGSDEPFVLCEKTGGLATHSACGACSRTRSGKSHNRTSHGRSESRSRCPCASASPDTSARAPTYADNGARGQHDSSARPQTE